MSDIRFNRWLHQSGTGGIYQDSSGNIGIGTSVPTSALDIQSGNIKIGGNVLSSSGVSTFTNVVSAGINVTGVVTATSFSGDGSSLTGVIGIPAGAVFYFAANSAPTGYLICDGSAISRTTYADLFAVVSTTFGIGDGSTTFNLPDLRGEFIRGFDAGKGTDSGRTFGSSQTQGTKLPTTPFTTNTEPNHNHTITSWTTDTSVPRGNGNTVWEYNSSYGFFGGTTPDSTVSTSSAGSHSHTITGGDAETRPRNIALLPCIKY